MNEQISIAEARRKRVTPEDLPEPERRRQRKFIRRIVVGDERDLSKPVNPVLLAINERDAKVWQRRTDALERARRDPAEWTRAVTLDERREQEFRARGLLPLADA